MNDDAHGAYNTNSQIILKATKLGLCDFSDAYALVKGTKTVVGQGGVGGANVGDENNKKVIFKNCASFTDYISDIDNDQVDNTKDLGVSMLM